MLQNAGVPRRRLGQAGLGTEQVGIAEDAGQGGLDVVRDVGDELHLHPVSPAALLHRPGHPFFDRVEVLRRARKQRALRQGQRGAGPPSPQVGQLAGHQRPLGHQPPQHPKRRKEAPRRGQQTEHHARGGLHSIRPGAERNQQPRGKGEADRRKHPGPKAAQHPALPGLLPGPAPRAAAKGCAEAALVKPHAITAQIGPEQVDAQIERHQPGLGQHAAWVPEDLPDARCQPHRRQNLDLEPDPAQRPGHQRLARPHVLCADGGVQKQQQRKRQRPHQQNALHLPQPGGILVFAQGPLAKLRDRLPIAGHRGNPPAQHPVGVLRQRLDHLDMVGPQPEGGAQQHPGGPPVKHPPQAGPVFAGGVDGLFALFAPALRLRLSRSTLRPGSRGAHRAALRGLCVIRVVPICIQGPIPPLCILVFAG